MRFKNWMLAAFSSAAAYCGAALPPAWAACGPEALGTSRVIDVAPDTAPLGLQSYPRTLALQDHEVILTFDDGPAAPTPAILAALDAECVKATFFLIGRHAEELPKIVRREAESGHTVAYHSYSHPDKTLRLMSKDAALADIERGYKAVDLAAFGAASARPRTPFFRFPGFADTTALLEELKRRDVVVFGTDLWASDWKQMTPQAELALVLERLEKRGKGIILFHDSKEQTAKMIPDFLRALKQRGYHVAHVRPAPAATAIETAPAGWTSTTEPIIAKTLGGKARATRSHEEAPEAGAPQADEAPRM